MEPYAKWFQHAYVPLRPPQNLRLNELNRHSEQRRNDLLHRYALVGRHLHLHLSGLSHRDALQKGDILRRELLVV